MRQVVAIGLLFILMFPLSMKMGIIAYFKIEQKEIIDKYCVNKNKPAMHCNGKCHLNKQLEKVEEQRSEQKSPLTNASEIFKLELLPFYLGKGLPTQFNLYSQCLLKPYNTYLNPFYLSQYPASTFHPPERS